MGGLLQQEIEGNTVKNKDKIESFTKYAIEMIEFKREKINDTNNAG